MFNYSQVVVIVDCLHNSSPWWHRSLFASSQSKPHMTSSSHLPRAAGNQGFSHYNLTKRQARPLKVLATQTLKTYWVPDDGTWEKIQVCLHNSCTEVRDKFVSEFKRIDWKCKGVVKVIAMFAVFKILMCGGSEFACRLHTSVLYSKSLIICMHLDHCLLRQ